MSQDVELWVHELEAAGWTRYRGNSTIWLCPAGHLFRGPYGAWCKMHAEPELSVKPEGEIV